MAKRLADPPVMTERRLRMGYDEFLAWWDAEGNRGEWVDGEVVVLMPPSKRHQRLIGFLNTLLSWYAWRFDLGEVVMAPFEMRLLSVRTSRQPDLLFVARDHAAGLEEKRLIGPADLAIEIVSDDSVGRDRQDKFEEYRRAGIPEYWIFDPRPRRKRASFFRLSSDGTYVQMPLDAAGRYHAATLPGFWLDPSWLWQDPLPDPDLYKPLIAPVP